MVARVVIGVCRGVPGCHRAVDGGAGICVAMRGYAWLCVAMREKATNDGDGEAG